MLQVGDRVVYPMHGAGEISGVEECDIMGQVKPYYVLQMPIGGMRIMIPADSVDSIGLRQISPPETKEAVREVLRAKPEKVSGSWNKRFHINLNRIKSGDVLEVAAVTRNLALQDKVKKISSGERKLLDMSRQILLSELSYILEVNVEQAEAWLVEQLEGNGF